MTLPTTPTESDQHPIWASYPAPFKDLEITADGIFAAQGVTTTSGQVKIGKTIAEHKVKRTFIDRYESLAEHDVVGQLFAADARIVERISASHYDLISDEFGTEPEAKTRALIRDYLRVDGGFEHLLLAGLRSSRGGLAWATFYRTADSGYGPFSDEDMERARYLVPAILYRWQLQNCAPPTMPKVEGGGLVPISPLKLRVAILTAQGHTRAEVANMVHKAEGTVGNYLTEIRQNMGLEEKESIIIGDLEAYAFRR